MKQSGESVIVFNCNLYFFFTIYLRLIRIISLMINADKKKEMKNLSEMLLETRNLTKQYGHHKAVDSVNMHIKKGAKSANHHLKWWLLRVIRSSYHI